MVLALWGCVGDAIVSRPLRSDGGADDAPSVGADPVLRIEVTATAEDNASARADFAASLEVLATRGGVPVDATLTVTRNGRPVAVRAIETGQYSAGLDDYSGASVLTVVTADGARHEVPLTTPPVFSFQSPRLHEHVDVDEAVTVAWSPTGGGAEVSLLTPGGPRPVPDTGRLSLAPGTFTTRGVHIIRMQRAFVTTPGGLPAGSRLTVAIVNSVEIEVE